MKRTYKAVDGWAKKAAVRLPGTQPLVLAEGVETALSIWQATGQETWACLGISNIASAPVPEKATVIVARDGDARESKADRQIWKTIQTLQADGIEVSVAMPPEGKDFNDLLQHQGGDAVRALIAGAEPLPMGAMSRMTNGRVVRIGSDVEISNNVKEDLTERHGKSAGS